MEISVLDEAACGGGDQDLRCATEGHDPRGGMHREAADATGQQLDRGCGVVRDSVRAANVAQDLRPLV
jgi:hypothetical protein